MDKSKGRDSRLICSDILQRNLSAVGTREKEDFLSLARSEKEHPLIRIDSAILLLEGGGEASVRNEVKKLAFELYEQGAYKDHVVMALLSRLSEDVDVEKFLVDKMRAEPDASRRDATLHLLGKRKAKALVRIIATELDSANPEKAFSKTRMYLALGDIGGREAYDLLLKHLPKEKSFQHRAHMLWAVGLTKDPRARQFLLDGLRSQPKVLYVPVLEGLKYLGDRSVMPDLQDELKRLQHEEYKRFVELTIRSLEAGDTRPSW